jgi:uncharacterized cupredoxin-like copper-binding protein
MVRVVRAGGITYADHDVPRRGVGGTTGVSEDMRIYRCGSALGTMPARGIFPNEVAVMSATSDQTHVESDLETAEVRGPSGGGLRGPLNWFGFVFGVVVLVGVGLLFLLTDGSDRAGEDVDTVDVASEPMPVDEHDEAATEPTVETQHEAAETGHVDEAAAPMVDATGKTVIEIEMVDSGYTPNTVAIQAGVPVVFRFTNTGNFEHEAMVGDMHEQEEFAAEGDHDADAGHHGDVMAVLVQPGQTADLELLVDEPGTTYLACHLPGHYERGQIATIDVAA